MTFFAVTSSGIEVDLPGPLVEMLAMMLSTLEAVGEEPDDPASGRLSVPVYLGDAAAQERWEADHGDRLDLGRMADRHTFRRVLSGETRTIDLEEAAAILRVLVEIRLMVAARLGIEVADDYDRLDDGEADLLGLLAWLQESVILALGAHGG